MGERSESEEEHAVSPFFLTYDAAPEYLCENYGNSNCNIRVVKSEGEGRVECLDRDNGVQIGSGEKRGGKFNDPWRVRKAAFKGDEDGGGDR